MVYSHVERDGNGLHVNYYDSSMHKEGSMELFFINPADRTRIHDGDEIEVLDVTEVAQDQPVTVHVSHPDGSCDDIRCIHT